MDEAHRHDVPRHGRSGFTVIEGRQVHYLEWGVGGRPPVLCLHGGGQTAYMFEDLGAQLRDRYHVLAPDLPSHGDSGPIADFSRHHLAATVPPLLEQFGVDRAVFVGASLGGITSITVAAAYPDLVAALVLIDVGHRLEDEGVQRIIEFMKKHESFASLEEAATEIAAYLPHRKEVRTESLTRNLRRREDGRWVWKHDLGDRYRQGRHAADWRVILEGLDEDATRVSCPTLVLRGSASDVLSSEGADEVAALISDARVETVQNAGHLAAGDNPASTVGLVDAFLTDVGW